MRKVKTLLMNPPVSTKALYGKFAKGGSNQPPLSLCYIASYLLKYGKDVRILDAAKLNLSISEVKKEISEYSPDVVGFHTPTPYYNSVKILAAEIKADFPNILVVAGGAHFTDNPLEDLEKLHLDVIVVSEGEQTVLEIVEGLERHNKVDFLLDIVPDIQGVLYRKNGAVLQSSPRPLIEDIDTIPIPARHLLPPLQSYSISSVQYKRSPSAAVMTARGCPYRCTFCVSSVSKKKVRCHSIEYVMREVDDLIEKYGIKDITFIDDVMTINKKRTYSLCEELAKRKKKLVWSSNIRIGLVDKEMLRYMKESGCWMVLVGIESGNQEILNRVKKQIKLQQAEQLSNWCKEVGLMFHPSFIIGHPGETIETINQTINFANKLHTHFPLFTIMVPYPGTELWRTAEEYGAIDKSNYDCFSLGSENPPFIPHGLAKEILIEKRKEAYKKCYLSLPMITRHLRTIRSFEDIRRMLTAVKILRGL